MDKHCLFGLISLECQNALRPTLDKTRATALGDQIASELGKVLRLGPQTSLVVAAACYPTEAILTPDFVVHNNLIKYASVVFQGEQQQHRVLAIGAHQGTMPDGLQPPTASAPLMHIPFVLITNEDAVQRRFEDTLVDKGMVSPPTYQLLSDFFQSDIVHANYMSHLDLIAMMHNHYDQVGMHHLWQVIEKALLAHEAKLDLQQNQQAFYLRGQSVFMPFYPRPDFLQSHPDKSELDYIHWLMAQRLAAEVFQSHGLHSLFFLCDEPQHTPDEEIFQTRRINASFYHHEQAIDKSPTQHELVDYIHPNAGYVWTVLTQTNGIQHWFYPLDQTGQSAIDHFLENQMTAIYSAATKHKQRLDGRTQESSGCH